MRIVRGEWLRVTYWSQTLRSWKRWTHRKSTRKDSMRKRWYFPNKENLFFQSQMDESKPLGGDQELRTSTLVRHRPIQGESNIDFLGESEGSPPQPQDSFPDAGEAIKDFWSMSGSFIYRHHVEPESCRFLKYLMREFSSALNKIIKKNQSGGTKGPEAGPFPSRQTDCLLDLRLLPGHWVHDSVENYADLFTMALRNDDIQEFDSKWDGNLLSMTKSPPDDILEGLYISRIRESEKLKTVLELYDLEIHQKKKLGLDYHRLKNFGDEKYRAGNSK